MLTKIMKICIFLLIAILVFLLFVQIFSRYEMKAQKENVDAVYMQSIEFLNDYYSKNVDGTHEQLETRIGCSISKDEWKSRLQNDLENQALIKLLKPIDSSHVSYILHSKEPRETYLVQFSLSVEYMGNKKKRTGELEYIKTDDGFKIHRFEIDVLDGDGRWGIY